MNDPSIPALAEKLGLARTQLLRETPFFGLLLLHMGYWLDEGVRTAATDGEKIFFAPAFLSRLTLPETKFILLHEILHAALEHCSRLGERSGVRFNIACDIVVNDTIKEQTAHAPPDNLIAGREIFSGTPDGRGGAQCSAEEVYAQLADRRGRKNFTGKNSIQADGEKGTAGPDTGQIIDNHDLWQAQAASPLKAEALREKWRNRIIKAALAAESESPGHLPLLARRALAELRKPLLNWRRILYNFARQETFDYTFEQPDRRCGFTQCIMPGWHDTRPRLRLWAAVDASGSMSGREIAAVLSELGEIVRISGLEVLVSFFDAAITDPVPLSAKNLAAIRPAGGGGTSYDCIFKMLRSLRPAPDLLVIMTDGYAAFPDKKAACGVPVLWLVNNMDVEIPWGHAARLP